MQKILKIFLTILLFFVFTIILTYPLIFNLNLYIPGFHSTDESFGALWNFWWLKYLWQHRVGAYICPNIAVPFGISSCKSGYPLWNFINKWLTIFTNNVFSYNFEILVSFILSGFFMYLLATYIVKDCIVAFFVGITYTFCPYHFVRSWQHLGLAQIQWLPLYILTILKLKEKPNFKNIIFTALALFLVFSFDFYYAYFMLISTTLFVIFLFIYTKEGIYLKDNLKITKQIIIAVILTLLLSSPSVYLIYKNKIKYVGLKASAHNPYLRPFEDLFSQSARPLSYILPASFHPILGSFTEQLVGSSWYGESFTEHTLYLGWVPLILAFVAFKGWKKYRKILRDRGQGLSERDNFYIGFFVFLAIVAWLFSQPPWWRFGPVKIFMPSFFMYKILPMFRAYCRFGIVVMLAVAVLAGFGLKFVLERFKNQKTKFAIAIFSCSLVLFEFWNWPPFKVIDVSKVPAVYYWLKKEPKDIVIAEYPLDINGANEMYKYYQTKHEKKIINGTIPGTYANEVAQTITKLSSPDTASVLKWMGVRYVLVHREDYLNTGLVEDKEELEKIPKNKALKFIKSFPAEDCPDKNIMCTCKTGPIDVYEVIAIPIEPKVKKTLFSFKQKSP